MVSLRQWSSLGFVSSILVLPACGPLFVYLACQHVVQYLYTCLASMWSIISILVLPACGALFVFCLVSIWSIIYIFVLPAHGPLFVYIFCQHVVH